MLYLVAFQAPPTSKGAFFLQHPRNESFATNQPLHEASQFSRFTEHRFFVGRWTLYSTLGAKEAAPNWKFRIDSGRNSHGWDSVSRSRQHDIFKTYLSDNPSLWLLIAYFKVKSMLRVSPPPNDFSRISSLWEEPDDAIPLIDYYSGRRKHSKIAPLPCHSHNDYWRKVPFFEAISYGCASVEADVWLPPPSEPLRQEFGEDIINIELQVGHSLDSLTYERTLDSLYLRPLFRMLYERWSPEDGSTSGIFESSPSTTLVLLIDFKPSEDIYAVWRALQIHLIIFRDYHWLTYWDNEKNKRVTGPLTIVTTGDAPFDEIVASPFNDVFYDAPLDKLTTDDRYNASNSYYASASLSNLAGKLMLGRSLNDAQTDKVESYTGLAEEKGLVARVWDIPSWPVATRNKIWEQLLGAGVGVLNVDDFGTATKRDWRLCKIAGIELCT